VPYERIDYSKVKDRSLKKLFERADAYLGDVYTMLSDHNTKRTKGGTCNLSAALVLLCILDALSKYVYPKVGTPKDDQKTRFTTLIVDKLHWEPPSKGWKRKPAAATILYRELRNTLTHALGMETSKMRGGLTEPTVGPWGNIKPKRISAVDARKKWPDKWPTLTVLKDQRGKRNKLTVAALYWAVKDLVKREVKAAS
jgi:hypothetical protein